MFTCWSTSFDILPIVTKNCFIMSKTWSRYLMWFAYEHIDFRHAEIDSILSLLNIPMRFVEKPTIEKPYWIVELPDENSAKKIASRSVALKNCIELWSRAKTQEQLHENLKKCIINKSTDWVTPEVTSDSSECHICPSLLIENCCSPQKSFKIDVETFCKHYSLKEKVEKIEAFSYLPLEGPIKLNKPDITLSYIEFYGIDPNDIPDQPYDVFFGRWVADGQRDLIRSYSLKKRTFIGNTSMDAQLSLLMANQAQVKAGDIIIDPFVGSGSLLVAAAHFGAYVWGSDIDFMMLHGRTRPTRPGQKVRKKDESIRNNMHQYGSERRYLDVIVSDFSRPVWRDGLKFDAIITDPPYGVREPTERIGIDKEGYTLSDEHLQYHVPAKVEYGLSQLYGDLLEFAARHLSNGGRLVCWYPIVREEYSLKELPSHPALRLVGNSEQVLTKLTARRLLTYSREDGHSTQEPHSGGMHNFRDKFFSVGEASRRERKIKKAEELAANREYIERSLARKAALNT